MDTFTVTQLRKEHEMEVKEVMHLHKNSYSVYEGILQLIPEKVSKIFTRSLSFQEESHVM